MHHTSIMARAARTSVERWALSTWVEDLRSWLITLRMLKYRPNLWFSSTEPKALVSVVAMISGGMLRRRSTVVDSQVQTTPDPELKLPKTSSLIIIITSNLLLQVNSVLQKCLFIATNYSIDIILYRCFFFEWVYRAPWGNIGVVWSHPRYSNSICGLDPAAHDEIRPR